MRSIDADVLKGKLLKIQADIINKNDAWKAAYLLILDEFIKMIDEMPSEVHHYDCNHDCDAIYEAYNRGFSKGREMEEQAKRRVEDYCENDCDTTNKIWKAIKMTKDELWSKVIKDLKTLDQEAHDEEFTPLITSTVVMEALRLRTSVANGTITQEDKSHMWRLIDDLGCYGIKGETIMYWPEYQEIKKLVKKVF